MPESNLRPVAVVTGSSSGIGAAIAKRLARDGYDVLVHAARNHDGAGETFSAVGASGARSHLEFCDFSDTGAMAGFVDRCFAWQGRVDAWINNAGADVLTGSAPQRPFESRLAEVLAVDVVGTLLLSRLVAKRMTASAGSFQRASGCIVNTGWDQAATGMAGDSGQMFAASKGAIMAATRSLAMSFAPHVRVNCVAPGWIRTGWGETASLEWQQRARSESLLDRWGTPEDVASVVSFLCGPDSSFVNGQVIPVNGGFRYGG
jgi:3-oxoacyl-[acyl-carrier protein] reductase